MTKRPPVRKGRRGRGATLIRFNRPRADLVGQRAEMEAFRSGNGEPSGNFGTNRTDPLPSAPGSEFHSAFGRVPARSNRRLSGTVPEDVLVLIIAEFEYYPTL